MLKIIEQITKGDGFTEFQNTYRETCEGLLRLMHEHLDVFKEHYPDITFTNFDEVKDDIKNLILNKLTLEVPTKFIENVALLTAEKPARKKRAKNKPKAAPKAKVKKKTRK